MLVKDSSARWLAFVFSKMSMRNLRTFKLLSKPLERDVIVENWELAMLTCEPFSEQTTGGPSSSCEMIILRNNSHGGIIRVCMGIFTTALRNKKYVKFSKKKNLTLLPQCVACYLTAYFDEKSPFKQVVYFEVFNVHKKSPLGLFL